MGKFDRTWFSRTNPYFTDGWDDEVAKLKLKNKLEWEHKMAQTALRRQLKVAFRQQTIPASKFIKNYGNWKYHDRPRPGVLHHVSHTGDEVWSVRAGTQRQMDVFTIRKLCDYADKFAEGFVRFTIRANIEFMVSTAKQVDPLIAELEKNGFPVGGTGNSITMMSHTQGWLHCDIPGTDASGVVKSLMDELIVEFKREEMPNRVHLSTSCCEINCGGQADLAIVIQHINRQINHEMVANVCRASFGCGALPGCGDSSCSGKWQALAGS
jgi:dissimilatory sulfite reductase beta subunit